MRRALAVFLAGMLALSGCASVGGSAPLPREGNMPTWRVEGPVAAGADPYVETARLEAVFGRDLSQAGIVPIQVFVRNGGPRPLWLRRSAIVLELPDGATAAPWRDMTVAAKQLPPTAVEEAAKIAAKVMAYALVPVVIGMFLFDPIGVIQMVTRQPAATRDEKQLEVLAREAAYWDKELKDALLGPGESAHGFVYFAPAVKPQAVPEATLVLTLLDIEEGKSFVARLPLRGPGAPLPGSAE